MPFQLKSSEQIRDIIWHPIYSDQFVIITENSLFFFKKEDRVKLIEYLSFSNIVGYRWDYNGE
jgi:hypothetical protein